MPESLRFLHRAGAVALLAWGLAVGLELGLGPLPTWPRLALALPDLALLAWVMVRAVPWVQAPEGPVTLQTGLSLVGLAGLAVWTVMGGLLSVTDLLLFPGEARTHSVLRDPWLPLVSTVLCGVALWQAARARIRNALEAAYVRQAEAGLLQARLAPHFLFNTLATLQAQLGQDPASARANLARLGRLFERALAHGERPLVPLHEELAFVDDYLSLQQARLGERLKVERLTSPEALASFLPPLSVQVLVENAVKYGVAPFEAGGILRIHARRTGKALQVSVLDEAQRSASADPLLPPTGTGTALATLRQRLASPEDLVLERLESGFRASFTWRQP